MIAFQVVGYKNAGKTTLLCELVRELTAGGHRVGTIKRDAHDTDPEPAGKDTRLHREAGAAASALATASRTSWVIEEPVPLERLLRDMRSRGMDIVLIEGFKQAPYPKAVLPRGAEDADLLALDAVRIVRLRQPDLMLQRLAAAGALPVVTAPDVRTDGGEAVRRIADLIVSASSWRPAD